MAHFNVFLFVDFVITFLGIYVIISAFTSKKKEQLSSLFLPPDNKISNMKGMVQFMFPRILIFGVVCVIYGGTGLLFDFVITSAPKIISGIATLLFIIVYVWFSVQLRKAREKFA